MFHIWIVKMFTVQNFYPYRNFRKNLSYFYLETIDKSSEFANTKEFFLSILRIYAFGFLAQSFKCPSPGLEKARELLKSSWFLQKQIISFLLRRLVGYVTWMLGDFMTWYDNFQDMDVDLNHPHIETLEIKVNRFKRSSISDIFRNSRYFPICSIEPSP